MICKMTLEWCKTWSMELSPKKCKVMHLVKQSSPKDYFIAEKKLRVTECERDLGVLVSSEWNVARTN